MTSWERRIILSRSGRCVRRDPFGRRSARTKVVVWLRLREDEELGRLLSWGPGSHFFDEYRPSADSPLGETYDVAFRPRDRIGSLSEVISMNAIRRNRSFLIAVVALGVFTLAGTASAQEPFAGNPVAKIARESSPAVVNIDVEAMVTRSYSPSPTIRYSGVFSGRNSSGIPERSR
jgi:hypothetical protein